MSNALSGANLPRWSLTGWLVDPGGKVPDAIRGALFNSLYGTIPIFLGGVFNTILVSGMIALRHPTPLFIGWALAEILLAAIRLPLVVAGLRAVKKGKRGPSDLYILFALTWAGSVGFGALICALYADWVSATLAWLSAGAMIGGICFRNFAAPRLAAAMISLSLGPCVIAGLMSGEPILFVTAIQIPAYVAAMSAASFRMNRMLVERMEAELEKDHLARHDSLTDLLNRAGLAIELERREAAGDQSDLAYLFLDLDGFKPVNDTLGHAAGDQLLVEIADRLRALAARDDIVVRLGGDEFLIVTRCADRIVAQTLGERVIRTLSDRPYLIGDRGVEIGLCVGVALSRDHGSGFARLIQTADNALYEAKATGRSRCVVAGLPSEPGTPCSAPVCETRAVA